MAVVINGSTGIATPDGSAGVPSHTGTSGSTNGLYFPTATSAAISTNGLQAIAIDSSQNVTHTAATTFVGNLTFSGASARFLGDFTNATVSTRLSFQTSTTNGTTGIYALPNGTSTAASWQATNAADPTNASKILIATNGSTDVQLVSGRNGTGTYLPLSFYTNGSQQMVLDTSGRLGIGTSGPTNVLAIQQSVNSSLAGMGLGIFKQGDDSELVLGYRSDIASGSFVIGPTYNTTGAYYPLAFRTSDTVRVLIDTYGSLLVGTTTSPTTTAGLGTISTPGTVVMGSSFKRNRIINGNMAVDQRNAGSAYILNNSAGYSTDRWWFSTGQAGTSQRVPTGNSDFPYATRIQRTSGQTGTNTVQLGQVIETINCQDLAGQTCTLSMYLTAGANFSAASSQVYVNVITGSGTDQGVASGFQSGTWTSWANNATLQTITTTRTRYTFPVSIPAGTNEIGIRVYFVPVGTAGANDYVDITGVQLEVGSIATPYERQIYSEQLAQCQRYLPAFSGTGQLGAGGNASSTTQAYTTIIFPVPARVAATGMTINAASNFVIGCAGVTADFTCTAVSASNHSTSGSLILSTVSSGLTAGQVITMRGNGSALMYFTGCEL